MKNMFKKVVCVSMASASVISGIAAQTAVYADTNSEQGAVEYQVPLILKKTNEDKPSMGNKAIVQTAKVVVNGDKTQIFITLKGLSFMNMFGHLTNFRVYSDKPGSKLTNATVVETYKDKDLDNKEREFPHVVRIDRDKTNENKIYVNLSVDAMASIASNGANPYEKENQDNGAQNAIITLDYSKAKRITPEKTPESKVENKNNSSTDKKEETAKNEETKIQSSRIFGRNRYLTSVKISKANFKKAQTVVLANGKNYADALASAPLASVNDAPILLTEVNSLSPETMAEIARLGAKNVIIVGGESSVSSGVESTLKGKGINVERVSGRNRYSTSIEVAKKVREKSADKKSAIVVSGQSFADALSVSSLATKNKTPIVLSEVNKMPGASAKEINSWNIEKLTVVGGQSSVSDSALKGINAKSNVRIAGRNRYSTSVEVAKASYGNAKSVILASGENAADALSAGAITGVTNSPLILVSKSSVSPDLKAFISANKVNKVTLIGGESSISSVILSNL